MSNDDKYLPAVDGLTPEEKLAQDEQAKAWEASAAEREAAAECIVAGMRLRPNGNFLVCRKAAMDDAEDKTDSGFFLPRGYKRGPDGEVQQPMRFLEVLAISPDKRFDFSGNELPRCEGLKVGDVVLAYHFLPMFFRGEEIFWLEEPNIVGRTQEVSDGSNRSTGPQKPHLSPVPAPSAVIDA